MRSDNHLFALLVIFVFVSGCANLQSDIGALDRKVSRQKREVQVVRQKQADLDTRLDALQVELQRVRGGVEESTHYSRKASDDMISLGEDFSTHIKWQEEELNLLREEIRTMKTLLGMKVSAQKDKPVSLPVKKLTPRATTIPPTSNLAKITGVPDPEELYNSAYSKLNKKDFQGARKEFREFLELFSQTEYSDNAQFWIGECYYREKRYEEAILEFEEVIKKFPQGNKLPDALLKQAFSFIALNDANSAKLLLQKILDRYPTSAQAEIAKNKLKSL